MILLGLTGFKGSGKSETASYLEEAYDFKRLSFAGPLKELLRKVDPILAFDRSYEEYDHLSDFEGLPESMIKRDFPEYRRLLVALGTDGIRSIDPDFWVKAFETRLREEYAENPNVRIVVDDVRMFNEADVFHYRRASELWQVKRRPDEGPGDNETEANAGNLGEHVVIENYGTLSELHKQVDVAVAPVIGRYAA